jgi:hypothetical protein
MPTSAPAVRDAMTKARICTTAATWNSRSRQGVSATRTKAKVSSTPIGMKARLIPVARLCEASLTVTSR